MGSTRGLQYELTLVLRSQIFEYVRETFYRPFVDYLQLARLQEEMKKKVIPAETPGHFL